MWWHNLIVLHAAVLPVVLWIDAGLRTRRSVPLRRGLMAYLVLELVLLVGLALGGEWFRRPVPGSTGEVPVADHEIRLALPAIRYDRHHWPRVNTFFYETYMRPFLIPASGQSEGEPLEATKDASASPR